MFRSISASLVFLRLELGILFILVLRFSFKFLISEIVISSSNNSVDKAIDKYHDTISYSGSSNASSSSSNSSSGGNTTDEKYTSGVLRIPLEVF